MVLPKEIPTVKMSNGIELPLFGYGTWQAKDEQELEKSLTVALENGYRLIDTAFVYGNEEIIGKTLQKFYDSGKLQRSDVFVTTKLPPFFHRNDDVEKCLNEQLKALKTDYIDLYLIHSPCPCKKDPEKPMFYFDANGMIVEEAVDHLETWKAMENLNKAGKVRSIGLSNFNKEQIQRICDNAEIPPDNLQVECHILFPQNELFDFCKSKGISFTAYAPLGSPSRQNFLPNTEWPEGDVLHHPNVMEISKKYGKTPAQILLRQLIQRGISAIPKSVTPSRIIENINIFDFELDFNDIKALEDIRPHVRLFPMKFRIQHSQYPYKDVLEAEKNK
uniref:NADP-dependent oxidoreductase domain-containing protein n=1 Tax=Panagrolaimus superbus TaxID=310955 RepID=A0A914Y3T6_9BILA